MKGIDKMTTREYAESLIRNTKKEQKEKKNKSFRKLNMYVIYLEVCLIIGHVMMKDITMAHIHLYKLEM